MGSASNWDRRRALGLCAGTLFSGLLPGTAPAQGPISGGADAWPKAKEAIRDASRMAERVVSALNSVGQHTQSALSERDKLDKSLIRLRANISELSAKRDSEMSEYRRGLFCSGCNRTKSEILRRGEQFPHPGQRIIRPTPQQIEAKEKELQLPIDNARNRIGKQEEERVDADARTQNGLRQIRSGLLLWRTSGTYYSRAVQRDLRYQNEALHTTLAELQRALQEEQNALAQVPQAEREQAQASIGVWQRQLEQQQAAVDAFGGKSASALQSASSIRAKQRAQLVSQLTSDPLGNEITSGQIMDAPIMPIELPLAMGVDFLMGRVPKTGESYQWLPNVASFVQAYRSFGALHYNAMGQAEADAGPAKAPTAPARSGNPLLQALP